jgi:hypothetical protein
LNGRCPKIKDGVAFQSGGKENTKVKINGHEFSKFVKEKGKAPITHNVYFARANAHAHVSHAHISYARTSHISHNVSHAKIVHLPNVKTSNASNGPYLSYHTFAALYVLLRKSGKVVAKYVGPHHKNTKFCVWVPKVLITNVRDPNQLGYLKKVLIYFVHLCIWRHKFGNL